MAKNVVINQDEDFKPSRPMGRPHEYSPDICERVRQWCTLGATDFEVSQFLGIAEFTLRRWRVENPDLNAAMAVGKEALDERVEKSLFHRAVGYNYETEEVFQYQGEVVRAKVVKHVPPDVTAQMKWLGNRNPNRWKDKQQVEHTGTLNLAAMIAGMDMIEPPAEPAEPAENAPIVDGTAIEVAEESAPENEPAEIGDDVEKHGE